MGFNLVGEAASPSLSQSCMKGGNCQDRWSSKVLLVNSFVRHSSFLQLGAAMSPSSWPELQTQRPQWQRDHSGQPWRHTLLMDWDWLELISRFCKSETDWKMFLDFLQTWHSFRNNKSCWQHVDSGAHGVGSNSPEAPNISDTFNINGLLIHLQCIPFGILLRTCDICWM